MALRRSLACTREISIKNIAEEEHSPKSLLVKLSFRGIKLLLWVFTLLNTQLYSYGQQINLTLVNNAVQIGAACLDGSPAGYHYAPGHGDGASHWMVYLMGGGWCVNEEWCVYRVKKETEKASTNNIQSHFFDGILSSDKTINPDFYDWNRVYVRYCDGASFMADVEEVIHAEINLHLRGRRIFRAVMDELLSKGMKNASNAILVGNSAGGLATILNCDGFRAFLPNTSRIKCISDSGFFIQAKHLIGGEHRTDVFRRLVQFHRIDKFLPTSCTSRINASLCFFPKNVVGEICTPLFLLNSAYDSFQLANLPDPYHLPPGWKGCTNESTITQDCINAHKKLLREFRNTFLQTIEDLGDSPTRGLFINSCFVHDMIYFKKYWTGATKVGDTTIAEAVGDWYFERRSVHLIETRRDIPRNC